MRLYWSLLDGSVTVYNDLMATVSDPVQILERELRDIFGARLRSLVAYGLRAASHETLHNEPHAHDDSNLKNTLAIVDTIAHEDLRACSGRVASWHDRGLATPLLLAAREFERSLDAFPLEFGAILADHVVVFGQNPFDRLTVDAADLRRSCEVQARSHLLHLREGYMETLGKGDAVALLIVRSAPAFAALLESIERLPGITPPSLPASVVDRIVKHADGSDMSSAEALSIFPEYLQTVERLVAYVDTWAAK